MDLVLLYLAVVWLILPQIVNTESNLRLSLKYLWPNNKYRFAFCFPYLPLKWSTKSMFTSARYRIKTVVGSILRQREVCDRGVSSKSDLPSGVVILFNLGFVSPGWGNRQPLLTQRLTHHKHTTSIARTIVCQNNAIVSIFLSSQHLLFCPSEPFKV